MADIPEIHDVAADGAADQRQERRLERERAMIAEGVAQLDRGECYDFDVIEAWLHALETDPDAKLPPFTPRT